MISFHVEDLFTQTALTIYDIEDRKVTCSCRQEPCKHAAYVYEVLSKMTGMEVQEFLIQKNESPNDIPPLTVSTTESMIGAMARHYNLLRGVLGRPGVDAATMNLLWSGRSPQGKEYEVFRISYGWFHVFENYAKMDELKYSVNTRSGEPRCNCSLLARQCQHIAAVNSAQMSWVKNGYLEKFDPGFSEEKNISIVESGKDGNYGGIKNIIAFYEQALAASSEEFRETVMQRLKQILEEEKPSKTPAVIVDENINKTKKEPQPKSRSRFSDLEL